MQKNGGKWGNHTKNASFYILCCILAVALLPLFYGRHPKSAPPEQEETVDVLDADTGETFTLDLEEYVWRVVAKEMPASFSKEALKAQAVAARTYTYGKIRTGNADHSAPVCTDSTHCQAFLKTGEEDAWGTRRDEICKTYQDAVQATRGEVLFYDGAPAVTVFHAMSSGKTENAKDVWGGAVPYLVSVDSEADKAAKDFESTAVFAAAEVCETVGGDADKTPVGEIVRTEGGAVKTVTLFGKTLQGTEVRRLFSLRSANFVPETDGENMVFHVYGYGHGVGMSQTGANFYAKDGMDYRAILQKYYPGTTISAVDAL